MSGGRIIPSPVRAVDAAVFRSDLCVLRVGDSACRSDVPFRCATDETGYYHESGSPWKHLQTIEY